MKNNSQVMNPRPQTKVLDWLYQEDQEDDFLRGKTPNDLPYIWEDEE